MQMVYQSGHTRCARIERKLQFNFQPIKWVENATPAFNQDIPEEKTIKEILELNPHKYKRAHFIVSVTVKSIHDENCWWYNSCDRCCRTSKPYGSTYRCSGCCYIGMPVPRYKVVLTAADNTSQAVFVLFGRIAHRLIHRPVESLIEENPPDFIPAEILALIDQAFVWNVSFTEDTVKRNQESLQVNNIVSSGAPKQHLLPFSPSASGGTSAIVAVSPGTSLQIPPTASESSIESQSSTKAKQSASLQPSPSTPTKYVVSPTTDDTPTSKSNPSGSSKKKYVISACPMQSQTKQSSIDDKATTEPKTGQKTLEHSSLPAAGPIESESENKGTFVNTLDAPPVSPSMPSKSASKKRTNTIAPTPAPPAKKLFKEHSQHTKDQR